MVKKILIILPEKKVYYICLFLKVNQCKFKQKQTILKLGNPLKSKSKFTKSKIVWGALPRTHWGPSDSRSNFLSVYNSKISPIEICSENTDCLLSFKTTVFIIIQKTLFIVLQSTVFIIIQKTLYCPSKALFIIIQKALCLLSFKSNIPF